MPASQREEPSPRRLVLVDVGMDVAAGVDDYSDDEVNCSQQQLLLLLLLTSWLARRRLARALVAEAEEERVLHT